jgi:hypothetical protein
MIKRSDKLTGANREIHIRSADLPIDFVLEGDQGEAARYRMLAATRKFGLLLNVVGKNVAALRKKCGK